MTECAPKTLPYFDSFEGMSSFDGTCYEVLQNMDGNGDPSVGFYTWSASDGDYCVQIECSKDEKTADGEDLFAMVVLPAFDEPLNNVSVSFDYLYESYNEFTPLYLGVLADINNPKSFQMIDAFGNEEGGYVSDRNWVYDVKVDLSELPAEYIGGRLAFKVQGGDGYGYDEVKVDDIQIFPLDYCYPVEKLTIDSFADNAVKFSWSIENEDIKKFEYLVTSADGSQELTAVVDTNVVKLTNLTFDANYTIKVRSVCSETNTADWVETSFRTLSTMPEFDYITGFESDDDNNLWVLANGEATNRFIIGSDATGVAAGSQALYISDNGTANNYNTGKPTVVYAYRSIHFTPGQYLVSYKWKSMGDYQNDYARVFFAPVYLPIEGGVVDNRIGKPNWEAGTQ